MDSTSYKTISPQRSYIVIPARLASTRLPRKLLLKETGKSLIQHTYESAQQARHPAAVLVATDHEDIFSEVVRFGGVARMTSAACASGTDRVAEVAHSLPDAEILVNVQGDEPDISGHAIDRLIELLEKNPTAAMATLATPIRDEEKLQDPACVKVVFAVDGRALYFSRSPIPSLRDFSEDPFSSEPPLFHQHIGIYAYRRDFLLQLADIPQTPLEKLEKLEQLRVLEQGHQILVESIEEPSIGIDTADDYRAFVARMAAA